ncbi:MAG: PP2C family protein-serine/threonine phosphatase [Lachnospiraceae bacterium]|uniref:PP2C family protein-serine/threonine phosphatase n=1 Tax=uncultured Acetatifactor sp. TaxID=1671927 RepID=UPI00260AB4E1|nr:PP2C family protein-serine/threonine phosphatase [uncultured Acetatifactor sp.]MCI8695162.1 PP2C family protein-serine/threonine phosphatase [Lachnospiraceae bacterium]
MRKHLVLKILTGFAVLAVLICAACTGIGYIQYRAYIQKQYNDMAYQVAETFLGFFEEGELERYIHMAAQFKAGEVPGETLEREMASGRYQELRGQMDRLREHMGANDIYLAQLDVEELYDFYLEELEGTQDASGDGRSWNPMTYIMDSYVEPYRFGDMGGLSPAYIKEAVALARSGERSDSYFISESIYGYNTSAILPIVLEGSTAAVIGVEIPMATLQKALGDYVSHSVLSMLVVTVLCLAVYVHILYRSIIAPINLIAGEASSFVKEENQVSTELEKIRTGDEIQTLSETLLKMERDINHYIDNLTKVTAEKERIGAELNVATQIQADMLPRIFPAFPGRQEFDIFATMNPAKEVGGDFYDFFLTDSDHLALVVADVSGKGIPAALFMVISKTLIKNQAQMGDSPAQILQAVNDQLCENNEAEMFVTVWLGILEISTGKLTAVNAGHEYPIMKKDGGEYEMLDDPHGFVMGVMPGMQYQEYEIWMHKGDSIYVYSDGAPDAVNAEEEQFERERLLASLNRVPGASPSELLGQVKGDIDRFVGEAAQFDDITMLCMRYCGS